MSRTMDDLITLGGTGIQTSRIGYGAFKIGRNQQTHHPTPYSLPTLSQSNRILNGILDLGIRNIDTAPAYGLSEKRIGLCLEKKRNQFVLSTKTGESFERRNSTYDYSKESTQRSVHQSLKNLRTDWLDIVYVHSNGRDRWIQEETDVVETLQRLKEQGHIRAIGFSGKTPEGAQMAAQWADVLMVQYNSDDESHDSEIRKASANGVGIVVKKGLGSGNLPAEESIPFVLSNDSVDSLLIGGLNLTHMKQNIDLANRSLSGFAA